MSSLGAVVAEVWEQVMLESPDPFRNGSDLWNRQTYRERLDRRLVNFHGQVIPRIVLVRRNLRMLGKPRRAPRLPA